MKYSAPFAITVLLPFLAATVTARDARFTMPQCAITCANSIPGATDSSLFCPNATLQSEVGACVKKICTIKEGLSTRNATASMCGWPDRDRSPLARNVAMSLLVPATMAVAARIISRMPQYNGPMGIDDYVIVVVWMLLLFFTALIYVISTTGLGRDIWDLPFDHITHTLKYFGILIYAYISLTWLTKISILFLYLRLFPDQTFRNIVKITITLCCLAWISFLIASILRCSPVDYAWTFWDGEHNGRCSDILASAAGWPHVCVNIPADLIVLILPLPTIFKLNLPLEKKTSVIVMFGTGIFVTAVSVFRATTFPRLIASNNFTWDWTEAAMWSGIEIYVGVVCACMPGVRAFTRQVFPGSRWKRTGLKMRTKGSRNHSGGSDPSSLGTIGSGPAAAKRSRREEEFELMSIAESNSGTQIDHAGEEAYAKRIS